jgi:DNA polymerase-1
MMNNNFKKTFVLVDAFNLYMRFLMVSQQVTSLGEPCGGVTGFLNALKWINRKLSPNRIYVIWETSGGSARRKSIYPAYKANRTKTSRFDDKGFSGSSSSNNNRADIAPNMQTKAKQLQVLTAAMSHLPICQIYVAGVEADDVIAYLAKHKFKDESINKVIISSDKDFYQLLNNSVTIYDPGRRIIVDSAHIKAIHEIAPENFCLARSVVGDDSDNIEGVEGIGLKTMAKRFKELSESSMNLDVDWLVETAKKNISNNPHKSMKNYKVIIENVDVIKRNWRLMYLDTNNLSAAQISKINYRVDEYMPSTNKIAFLKELIAEDIPVTEELDQLIQELRPLSSIAE